MKRLARAAIVMTLRDELASRGSWAGETHLQKGLYVLQAGADVPLEFNFILYKHGPFSFDLREELLDLRADGLLSLQPQSYPYGPRLLTTEAGRALLDRFPKTLSRYGKRIEKVADLVRDRGVAELERLGTALLMIQDHPDESDTEIVATIRQVKPHVGERQGSQAVEEMRAFLRSVN